MIRRDAHRNTVAWTAFATLIVAAVFFLATHDLLAALQWRETLPDEVRELVREVADGRMQRQLAFPLLAVAGAVALLLRSPLRPRWEPAVATVLAAFLAWQLLSVVWASDPLLTGKRLLVLTMMAVGAAGLVRQLGLQRLPGLVVGCTLLHLMAGLFAELWLGTLTPLEAGYRFAGTLHPNQQGINCALLVLGGACLARTARSSGGRVAALTIVCTGLGFLGLTRSRTAMAAALLALLLFVALEASPLRRIAVAAVTSVAASALLLLNSNGILSSAGRLLLLGRDDSSFATFTGRTEIWSYALRHAVERPIVGHGYNSFWSPRHTAEVSGSVDWKISEGHSAYIDTLLNLGVVGLVLFGGLMIGALVVAVLRHRRTADPAMAFAAALLLFGLLDGLLESAVVIPNLLSFVTLAVLVGLAAFGGRAEAVAAPWAGAPRHTGALVLR